MEEKVTRVECSRLQEAYAEMRAESNEAHYFAMLDAFAADLAADAYAFEPVAAENVEALHSGGKIKWQILNTPKGKMLALYTSREQVEKHPASASVGVGLRDFVQMALSTSDLAGILVNPLDGHYGIPIERRNLEVLVRRAQTAGRPPQLNPAVISKVVYRLWEVAVGVPTAVYDAGEDLKALGGAEGFLKPVLERWNERVKSGDYKPKTPEQYVRDVLHDVIIRSFVCGVFVRHDVEMAKSANPDECLGKVPNLADDVRQNLDEYLILLCDTIRSGTGILEEGPLWQILATNVGVVAFGAMVFGFGWGLAKFCQTQGPMALAELRDRQQAWREKIEEQAAAQAAAENEKQKKGVETT